MVTHIEQAWAEGRLLGVLAAKAVVRERSDVMREMIIDLYETAMHRIKDGKISEIDDLKKTAQDLERKVEVLEMVLDDLERLR